MCTITNTVIMAKDNINIDPTTAILLDNINLVFFYGFCLELVIKLIGLGPKTYFKSKN